MHPLLERQLRHHLGDVSGTPAALQPLLEAIEAAYRSADEDRALLERSLDLTSQELLQRNADLNREIQQLAATKEALAASEHRYRLIVETASEGIWEIADDHTTTFANETMAQMLGYAAEEMKGRSFFDFLHEASRNEATQFLDRQRRGLREQHDFRFRRRDGADLWAIVSGAPVTDEWGRYRGALAMITDITERKRDEDRVRDAYKKLKELDSFRTQFINNTAHELATPLTPILLQIELLRKTVAPKLEDNQRKSMEILDRNIRRLSGLLKDVLDASRIQTGRLKMDFGAVDLGHLVSDTSHIFQSQADATEIRLACHVEPGLVVVGDPKRLTQVIFNLLSNAIKFTPKGGRVSVDVRQRGQDAEVQVADTGFGIDPHKIPLLFQPFTQVHDDSKILASGTGLGLFVSRGIVEEHRGQIWCDSPGIGQGTTFGFRVPLASAAPDPAQNPAGATARSEILPALSKTPTLSPP